MLPEPHILVLMANCSVHVIEGALVSNIVVSPFFGFPCVFVKVIVSCGVAFCSGLSVAMSLRTRRVGRDLPCHQA